MNFLTVCNSCGTFSFARGRDCTMCIHMQMFQHHLWMFVDDLSHGWSSIGLRSDLRHPRNKWFDVSEALSSWCCEAGPYLADSLCTCAQRLSQGEVQSQKERELCRKACDCTTGQWDVPTRCLLKMRSDTGASHRARLGVSLAWRQSHCT